MREFQFPKRPTPYSICIDRSVHIIKPYDINIISEQEVETPGACLLQQGSRSVLLTLDVFVFYDLIFVNDNLNNVELFIDVMLNVMLNSSIVRHECKWRPQLSPIMLWAYGSPRISVGSDSIGGGLGSGLEGFTFSANLLARARAFSTSFGAFAILLAVLQLEPCQTIISYLWQCALQFW